MSGSGFEDMAKPGLHAASLARGVGHGRWSSTYLSFNLYALTGGGPANATMVLSMFTYLASFVRFDFSLGAAASWVMLVMSMLMCLFFIAVIRRREAP